MNHPYRGLWIVLPNMGLASQRFRLHSTNCTGASAVGNDPSTRSRTGTRGGKARRCRTLRRPGSGWSPWWPCSSSHFCRAGCSRARGRSGTGPSGTSAPTALRHGPRGTPARSTSRRSAARCGVSSGGSGRRGRWSRAGGRCRESATPNRPAESAMIVAVAAAVRTPTIGCPARPPPRNRCRARAGG